MMDKFQQVIPLKLAQAGVQIDLTVCSYQDQTDESGMTHFAFFCVYFFL